MSFVGFRTRLGGRNEEFESGYENLVILLARGRHRNSLTWL